MSAIVPPGRSSRAFTLTEVALALGLVSFVLVSLLGLLSVGIATGRESEKDVQTANIASLLVAQRRAAPTNANSSIILPALNANANALDSPVYLTAEGKRAGSAVDGYYRLRYSVQTDPANVSRLYLSLSSPAVRKPEEATTWYEIITYVRLP